MSITRASAYVAPRTRAVSRAQLAKSRIIADQQKISTLGRTGFQPVRFGFQLKSARIKSQQKSHMPKACAIEEHKEVTEKAPRLGAFRPGSQIQLLLRRKF